jgi:hypothetical protein
MKIRTLVEIVPMLSAPDGIGYVGVLKVENAGVEKTFRSKIKFYTYGQAKQEAIHMRRNYHEKH